MKMREFFREYVRGVFICSILAFILLSILGYIICLKNAELAKTYMEEFAAMVQEKNIVNGDGDVSAIGLFRNNLQATGMATLLGVLPFLFLPVWVLLSNGLIMGAIFSLMEGGSVYALKMLAAGILPHGIFEIPAICLGVALGIRVCQFLCCKIIRTRKLGNMRAVEFFGNIARVFVLVCIPLLIIAALIEANITPILLNMVM